ncbi:putative membrane protein [Wickerhamomyces ciferrii]|uniref:Membrane protein n=1 Tax=Wickerhamomyces ciferrii (strain ATCC 14091 / BCRC 22168 / CBS 111 / JCM 3599 / NBRC 0793 / NRRL Y-1031 F-60-10) TaxID=1206466 RepID=K0KLF2_WICCF|nr:uncharacterized protein BN7_3350 [Wickerhamomyces ciferrii]CCH43796.1 putative membrane protein [Wickerhamomyces ciferrii]
MSFLNQIPLPNVCPVELILGIAILNKLSGLFGILSIFTGHPLDFIQWLLYITSLLMLPYYFLGASNIRNPKILEHSVILIIYSIDTLTSLGFILWFAGEWFINEDVTAEIKPGEDYSKSASQNYEYGWIFLMTFVINLSRFYFNFILLSFYIKLIKFNKIQGIDYLKIEGDELNLKNKYFWQRWNYKIQIESYKFLERTL